MNRTLTKCDQCGDEVDSKVTYVEGWIRVEGHLFGGKSDFCGLKCLDTYLSDKREDYEKRIMRDLHPLHTKIYTRSLKERGAM